MSPNEGTRCHDNIAVVAGHGPGFRRHIGVNRCAGLYAKANTLHVLSAAQLDHLDNVRALFADGRRAFKPQLIHHGGAENSGFKGLRHYMRSHEKALEQKPVIAEGPPVCQNRCEW